MFYFLCQGSLASGLVQKTARDTEVRKPPAQKAIYIEHVQVSQGNAFKIRPPITMLIQLQTTFTAGLELGLNGVICRFPQIPRTK